MPACLPEPRHGGSGAIAMRAHPRARARLTRTPARALAHRCCTSTAGVLGQFAKHDQHGLVRADVCGFVGQHPGGSTAVRAFHLLPHCEWNLLAFAKEYNANLDRDIYPEKGGPLQGHAVSASGQRRTDPIAQL